MKISVSLLLSFLIGAFANAIYNNEIAQRRQFIGYANNVLHDQSAQSSVKVNFNPYQAETRSPVVYSPQTNSQLFNVGYSVRFTNTNKQPEAPKYPRSRNLDDGEIITGTRKQNEEVQSPSLIQSKAHKISGIKPKPQFATNYPSPKVLLTQANLSPNTQKYYKSLEKIKPQIQNPQELQQKYTWRTLSPGVEIIRSTEVPTGQKHTRTEFDHARALGKSQEFDFSNALETKQIQQPNTQNVVYYNVRKVEAQTEKTPIVSKIPVDTTLLREQIPIQVDTRLIEEAMRTHQLAVYNPQNTQTQEQPDDNYLQAYRTIPENAQPKQVQVVYRQEPQFQDFQTDQSRYQLKIYGKPQPVGFNDGQEELKRHPRYLGQLHTNLRPPPVEYVYQRRYILG